MDATSTSGSKQISGRVNSLVPEILCDLETDEMKVCINSKNIACRSDVLSKTLHLVLCQKHINLEKVTCLLEDGASVLHKATEEYENLRISQGQNALQIAVSHHNSVNLVQLILHHCADSRVAELIDNPDCDHWDAIHTAVTSGHQRAALWIYTRRLQVLPPLNVSAKLLPWKVEDFSTTSSLYIAAWHGMKDLVKIFINSLDKEDRHTALNQTFWEASNSRQYSCATMLLSMGADANFVPDSDKLTSLCFAVQSNNSRMVKRLVTKYGANVNCGTDSESNPLRIAIQMNNIVILNELIKLGADFKAVTKTEPYITSFLYAIAHDSLTVAKRLVACKVDPLVLLPDGKTALHIAAGYKNSKCLHYLLSPVFPFHHNIDQEDKEHSTPIAMAVCKGHHLNVETFLRHGANPNLHHNSHCTLLVCAVLTYGHVNTKYIIRTMISLLQHGANCDVGCQVAPGHFEYPMDVAHRLNASVLMELLWEAGSSKMQHPLSLPRGQVKNNPATMQHYGKTDYSQQPRALMNLCRLVIRDRLSSLEKVPTGIQQLTLPTAIKNYLNFCDLKGFIYKYDKSVKDQINTEGS